MSYYIQSALGWPDQLNYLYQNMRSSITSTVNFFDWLESFADPRVEDWPLMSGPGFILAIFFLYLYVANKGPIWMENKKPLKLRWLIIAYNLSIAYLNLWMALELIYCAYKLRYSSLCQLVKITNNPYELRIANVVWWYWASKGFEFADTAFFIVRKKNNQLSFLHKYHHSTMFIIWWTAAKFVPGGSVVIPITVNSSVHVLMYSYYGLSAVPSMQKYLWWKRHLTIIQLIQFVIGVSIGIYLISSGCQFTRWMQWVFSAYAFSFIILFGNFYLQTYKHNKGEASENNFIDLSVSRSFALEQDTTNKIAKKNGSNKQMDEASCSNGQDEMAEAILRQRKYQQQINQKCQPMKLT